MINSVRLMLRRILTKVVTKVLLPKPLFLVLRRLYLIAQEEAIAKSCLEAQGQFRTLRQGYQSWGRIPMYDAIYESLQELAQQGTLRGKLAIEIGGSEGSIKSILESFGVSYKLAPDFPQTDIHHLKYEDNSFDFVILDQVLEHVEKPWIAVDQIYRVLKPNGIAVITTPFIHAYHACPKDYWRFTPDAFRVLFSRFEILALDGWGNAEAVRAGWSHSDIGLSLQSTPLWEAIEKRLFESNDRINYIVVWCIARKPLA